MKLLFDYSQLNEPVDAPSIFISNADSKGLNISEGRPSCYQFSFYEIISEQKVRSNDNLDDWIKNSSLTVIIDDSLYLHSTIRD